MLSAKKTMMLPCKLNQMRPLNEQQLVLEEEERNRLTSLALQQEKKKKVKAQRK
jgi:hypothetical protein